MNWLWNCVVHGVRINVASLEECFQVSASSSNSVNLCLSDWSKGWKNKRGLGKCAHKYASHTQSKKADAILTSLLARSLYYPIQLDSSLLPLLKDKKPYCPFVHLGKQFWLHDRMPLHIYREVLLIFEKKFCHYFLFVKNQAFNLSTVLSIYIAWFSLIFIQ